MFSYSGSKLVERVRKKMFEAMLKQEMGWYDQERNNTGALCARLSSSAEAVSGGTGAKVGQAVGGISTLFISIGLAIYYDWRLGLVTSIFTPILIVSLLFQTRLMTKDSGVKVITNDGQVFQGQITFISSSADEMMHTFDIEISIPNPLGKIKDGQTAKVIVSATPELAHIVPLSILRLDEAGNIGVRVVNKENLVEFYTVEIIQDTEKGVWVTGLPFNSRIITVGQDYVNNNQKVDIAIDYRMNTDENIN